MNSAQCHKAAENLGLVFRGSCAIEPDDNVPLLPSGQAVKTLLLFGNAGSSLWPHFSTAPEFDDGEADPLNRWSERLGNKLAAEWGGIALFPFGGPPYQPFMQWAKKAEGLTSSELGILLHPDYGLWHAYRFAVAIPICFDQSAGLEAGTKTSHACNQCADKPCLGGCPVNAFTNQGYDVQKCFNFLDDNPESSCHRNGCNARLACPEGLAYRYQPDHAAFHMRKFYQSLVERFSGKD